MSDCYIGEIRMFGGNFAPVGWAFCDGSLLSIAQYDALFNLIGTTYGGDGQTTFALPDLRGRFPVHQGQGAGLSPRTLGEMAGSESVTLQLTQIPSHNHIPVASTTAGNSNDPGGMYWASSASVPQYLPGDQANTNMNTGAIGSTGGSQPHDNMQPYLVINFIISLEGIYPSQN
jgi:microcystin-dependent protein